MSEEGRNFNLGDVLEPSNQKMLPLDCLGIPYIGLDNIEAQTTRLLGVKDSSEMKSSAKCFKKGDVLYSRLRPYLNKVWLADRDGLCSAEFIVLPQNDFVDGGFLKYRLSARDFVSFANSLNAGDRPRVDFEGISSFLLPPFSLSYQRSVVARIEELFSEIDAGVDSFKQARKQLGLYRQSLLQQAFCGKLTEAWRAANPDLLEDPEELLERIRQERETRYQQQVVDWETAVGDWEKNGKEGKKPAKPTKLAQIDPIPKDKLLRGPSLPAGWLIFEYGKLCSLVRNGLSAKPSGKTGYKISRISAVRPMFFDYSDYRFLDCKESAQENYNLLKGDLIFTMYNGARRYVGVCAYFDGREPRLYPDKLIRTCPNLPSLSGRFLEFAMNSGLSRDFIESKIRTTAGQSGVSGGDIKVAPIIVPSLPEQNEIVRILESQFTAIEQNEREIDAALKRADALRQSILKKAFSGQLVPQDPNDEPASALLSRIREERAVTQTKTKAKRKSPTKKAASVGARR